MHSCRLFLLYFHLLFFGGRPQATVKRQFLNNKHGIDNENICPRICTAQLPPENEICLFSIILYLTSVYTFTSSLYWHTTESDRNFYRTLIKFVSSAAKRPSVIKSTYLFMLYCIQYNSTDCRKLFKSSSRTMIHINSYCIMYIIFYYTS